MTAEHQAMRKSSRYPYTYAYDYIREAHANSIGQTLMSREDAAKWAKEIIENRGLSHTTHEEFCTMLAEQYITHAVKVAEAEEIKKENFKYIRSLSEARKT